MVRSPARAPAVCRAFQAWMASLAAPVSGSGSGKGAVMPSQFLGEGAVAVPSRDTLLRESALKSVG